MGNRIYNVVIIGYGGMGSYHVQLIESNQQLAVGGVYDIVDYRMELAAAAGYKTYASLDAVLADQAVDIVLIATPNDVHKEIAIQALQAGKHVICEKPVTITSADFLDIVEVAKKENRVFTVHQNRRWDEDFRIIKDIIGNKTVGELFQLESRVQGLMGFQVTGGN